MSVCSEVKEIKWRLIEVFGFANDNIRDNESIVWERECNLASVPLKVLINVGQNKQNV